MPRHAPPPITKKYLQWAANEYLKRYFGTRAHLRRLLMRRVDRSIAEHGGDREAFAAQADEVLDELVASRALDDELYAKSKVRSLVKKGKSQLAIRERLGAAGVGRELVKESLAAYAEEEGGDPTMEAALAFARKRRLGPWRLEEGRADSVGGAERARAARDKDVAKMARAGFPWDVVRKVLDADPEEVG